MSSDEEQNKHENQTRTRNKIKQHFYFQRIENNDAIKLKNATDEFVVATVIQEPLVQIFNNAVS